MDDFEKIGQLRELTQVDPNDALGWFMLGSALVQVKPASPGDHAGHYIEAIAALNRCIELNPGHTAAYRWLGDACRKAGDLLAARAAYESAIQKAEETGDLQVAKEANALLAKIARPKR